MGVYKLAIHPKNTPESRIAVVSMRMTKTCAYVSATGFTS